jgi:glycosyltransferase involved in cell wall biosynthesis
LLSFEQVEYDTSNESYLRKWTEDINKYANNYNHIDVSLAPIVESVFNSNKSQLKIIEAGFHKKAVIASDVNPYTIDLKHSLKDGNFTNDGNSLLVSPKRNHRDWEKYMKKLVDNPNMITDMGERLYETVKDKYSLPNVSKNRVEFIKSILTKY